MSEADESKVGAGSGAGLVARTGDDAVWLFRTVKSRVSGRLVRLGSVADTVITRHATPDGVSEVLGQALALVAMMGSAIKFDGKLIVQTKTDGALDFLVVDYQTPGSVRGYVRYDKARVAATSASDLLGSGYLAMTIDQGPDMERYQGIVALDKNSLAEAAQTYFRQSEQLPTYLRLAVARHYHAADDQRPARWSWRAGGLMLQYVTSSGGHSSTGAAMSDVEPGLNGEDDEDWTRARLLAETTEDHELLDPTLSPERLLYRLFHEEGVRLEERLPMTAYCRCSREKVAGFLESFGPDQLIDMRTEDGSVTVTCEFCTQAYRFDAL